MKRKLLSNEQIKFSSTRFSKLFVATASLVLLSNLILIFVFTETWIKLTKSSVLIILTFSIIQSIITTSLAAFLLNTFGINITKNSHCLLTVIRFLYSKKLQKEIFEPIIADWQEEYFEALFNKKIWKARWIHVRYIYNFLAVMWLKSPIGDLIEFIRKFTK